MKPLSFLSRVSPGRSGCLKLAAMLLCFLVGGTVFGQIYTNKTAQFYNVPSGPLPPQINATAFLNQSIFSITYNQFLNNQIGYSEPWVGTIYFTNNGEMLVGSTIGNAYGYEFDTQGGNSNVMAGTFYNPGTIHCDSILDGNFAPGGCIISATNVMVPGNIEVGVNGSLKVTGQKVDLSRSLLTVESEENLFALFGLANIIGDAPFAGTGVSGVFTNAWTPLTDLLQNSALSAGFPLFPFGFQIVNSTPYNLQSGPNLNRSAFVENVSPSNVVYNVYFGDPNLGSGEATIGWAGTYQNYATGQTLTNYLYLNDDYLAGAVTNVPLSVNGYPDNFTLTESTIPLTTVTPATPNLPLFPNTVISNATYVYANIQGDPISLTNVTVSNPGGSITNIPAQLIINASRELNLSYAQISGVDYLSVNATNQFDQITNAQLSPLFSDFNLATTNGSLTISNLLESQIPDWTGTIQAWSTRFFVITTNTIGTNSVSATNEWRTVLVFSDLFPVTQSQVRNMTLNVTNSIMLSDALNIFGNLKVTAQSLTLTTNLQGVGAMSPEGELNLENANSSTWSWPGAFPNLFWLTNNGAIIVPNSSDFISSTQIVTVVPAAPAVPATATLTENGANVQANSTVTIVGQPYTFTSGPLTSAYSVKIGANFDASMTNLIAAINFSAGGGLVYNANNSFANGFVMAYPLTNHTFTVAALSPGPLDNGFPVSASGTANATWNSSSLSGGTANVPAATNTSSSAIAYGAIINNGLLMDQGSEIWAANFENGGVISNGVGLFTLNSSTATFTNGIVTAGGDISITSGSLEASNLVLQAGRSLTLDITNTLTDDGVTNGNIWSVDDNTNATGFDGLGLILPVLPTDTSSSNNLLGTTILIGSPPPNKLVASTWAGNDYGVSTTGYTTNNVAIGQLILTALAPNSSFYFAGTGVSNAIYVDRLILQNYASLANVNGSDIIPTFNFNPNLVIYYADAQASTTVTGGPLQEASHELNHANGNHFRWVPLYNGHFSSTNIVYLNGTTNTINVGLAASLLDSNNNGIPNDSDPDPIFEPSQINFKYALTNTAQGFSNMLTWDSIPNSTSVVSYKTNMTMAWVPVYTNIAADLIPPAGPWPVTNLDYQPIHPTPFGFYRVSVTANPTDEFGQ